MKLELGMRQSMVMAPQLIQSLKMLQLPVLKLEQMLRQELATNPMLEEDELVEATDESERLDDLVDPAPAETSPKDEFDWENYLGDDSEFVPKHIGEQSEESWERTPVVETTLYDHLVDQLKLTKLTDEEVEIGEFIIGNLDSSGLLTMSVEELAEALKVTGEKVTKVLTVLQGFDPAGVAARDIREALLIQLEQKGMKDGLAARIIREHYHELDRKTHQQLSKSLGVTVERIREAMDELRTLSPRPAQGRFTTAAMPVVPDLVVDRVEDQYVVYHNDRSLPRLRVTAAYKDIMRRGSGVPTETRKYVKDKLEQARWLINAINQRRSTMTKVMEAIVEEQHEFFEKGAGFLKPLRMSDIADKVGMNVATVSRVSKEKYVQTPQGVREIKSFFSGGVEMAEGDAMSKRNVKSRIAELIHRENSSKPLSDQEIYKKLQAEGIKMARRTVTKYREELKIPSARFRKRESDVVEPGEILQVKPAPSATNQTIPGADDIDDDFSTETPPSPDRRVTTDAHAEYTPPVPEPGAMPRPGYHSQF